MAEKKVSQKEASDAAAILASDKSTAKQKHKASETMNKHKEQTKNKGK